MKLEFSPPLDIQIFVHIKKLLLMNHQAPFGKLYYFLILLFKYCDGVFR